MADNTTLNTGTGGDVIASDDISGVKYQRAKRSYGRDGIAADVGTGFRKLSAASTNATSLKASAGTLFALYAVNLNAAMRYVKFYDKASAPTVGTDVPHPGQHDRRGLLDQLRPRYRLPDGHRLRHHHRDRGLGHGSGRGQRDHPERRLRLRPDGCCCSSFSKT